MFSISMPKMQPLPLRMIDESKLETKKGNLQSVTMVIAVTVVTMRAA